MNRITLGGIAAVVTIVGIVLGGYYQVWSAQTAHASRAEDRYARRDDLRRIEAKLDWIIREMSRGN